MVGLVWYGCIRSVLIYLGLLYSPTLYVCYFQTIPVGVGRSGSVGNTLILKPASFAELGNYMPYFKVSDMVGTALAYIEEKSHGISPYHGIP